MIDNEKGVDLFSDAVYGKRADETSSEEAAWELHRRLMRKAAKAFWEDLCNALDGPEGAVVNEMRQRYPISGLLAKHFDFRVKR
jgi:hypothetical protein